LRLHNLKLKQHAVNKVGAGLLAKAQHQSINESTDRPPSQASQLPHLDLCSQGMRGVWESGARQCPLRVHNLNLRQHAINKVGAGLLAKAPDQSINESTDTPPSQASQLPHLDLCSQGMRGVWESGARQCQLRLHNLKLRQHAVNKVGAGLLAKAQDQSINELTDTPPSQASQLPHLDLCSQGMRGVWESGARQCPLRLHNLKLRQHAVNKGGSGLAREGAGSVDK
jgi:hypothetical protein